MIRIGLLLLMVMSALCIPAFAQDANSNDPYNSNVDLDPHFSMMTKEVGGVCGPFLPDNITGITEMMSLCGARVGLKIGDRTTLEPQIIAGAGSAQRYILGTLNFRGDVQMDDLIGSFYGGGAIHYATNPVYNNLGKTVGDQTNIYFGVDIGGAIWWMFNDWWGIRTDLQFNLNPGTSLYVGFGLEFRFDPQSNANQTGSRKSRFPLDLALGQ